LKTLEEIKLLLASRQIQPTSQRLRIAETILQDCAHYSAEEVFNLVNRSGEPVSKATVYNTLGLFARQGLLREVIADPDRVYFDTNLEPHHHLYDTTTGRLTDVSASSVEIGQLPELPSGMRLEGVDVILRVRPDEPTTPWSD